PGHLRNATPVPRPNLRADVINNCQLRKLRVQRMGVAQIKSRVIDQHDCAWLHRLNLRNSSLKLLSKKRVTPDHLPSTDDSGVIDPIANLSVGESAHFRSAASHKSHFRHARA